MADSNVHFQDEQLANHNSTSGISQSTIIYADTTTISDSPSPTAKSQTKNNSWRIIIWLMCIIAVLGVCFFVWKSRNPTGTDVDLEKQKLWENLAYDINAYMDKKFDPCENFYEYACTGWKNWIGSLEDEPLSVLELMTSASYKTMQKVFDRKNTTKMSQSERKARDFYLSCINQDKDESLSLLNAFPSHLTINNNISDIGNYTNMDEYFGQFRSDNLSSKFLDQILNLEEPSANETKKIAWKCLSETILLFPDVTGQMFVREVMPAGPNPNVYDMFSEIKKSYVNIAKSFIRENFKHKRLILKRLSNVPLWNGYPQSIMDNLDTRYESINISNNTYMSNRLQLSSVSLDYWRLLTDFAYRESKFIKANAFYDRLMDAVVVTAGILRRPIYGSDFPNVMNYAGLGFTMGHELSHAFYNYYYQCEDCLYGENDPKVCLEDFYSHLTIDGKFINGSLTLEENFSDIFGLHVAYSAYKNSKTTETLPGLKQFTHKQLFFVTLTQTFCMSMGSKEKEMQYIENQLKNDTHAPKSVRILGMYSNFKEFAKAFNCPVGSAYNPVKKCKIF